MLKPISEWLREDAKLMREIGHTAEAKNCEHAADQIDKYQDALAEIAKGRTDCGRPLGGEVARQLARKILTEQGLGWNSSVSDTCPTCNGTKFIPMGASTNVARRKCPDCNPSGSGSSDTPTPTNNFKDGEMSIYRNSDTPTTTSDSDIKPDEPQNSSINSVSPTDGDITVSEFECPINQEGCTANCGNYGCGN